MYIAEVTATNQWKKLEDLIKQKVSGFTFDSDKEYTIQNLSDYLNLIELNSTPTTQNGLFADGSKEPIIYKKGSGDLYVKALTKCLIIVADNS